MSLSTSISRFVFVLATVLAVSSPNTAALAADLEANEAQAAGPDSPIPPRFIYAVTTAGSLLVYLDNSSDTAANWLAQAVATPPIAGLNWANFAKVFAGGDGIIYAIDRAGSLHYFRLIDPYRNAVAMSWSADSNSMIGLPGCCEINAAGFSRFAPGRDGTGTASSSLVRAIWDTSGAFYEHGWRAGGLVEPTASNWTNKGSPIKDSYWGPPVPPRGGPYNFEGGGGITYTIDLESGNLLRFRIHPDGRWVNPDGTLVPDANAKPLQIGTGWSGFKFVTASPGEYLIEGYVSTATLTSSGGTVATMSVTPGAKVKVRASTFSPTYAVRLLRLHRDDESATPSGLIEGAHVNGPFTATAPAGGNFKKAENFTMYSKGAQWSGDINDIPVPSSAEPGIYAAELTTPIGGRYLAPFVVKPSPKSTPKNIVVIANVSTWNAYNLWGGSSRYNSLVNPAIDDTPFQKEPLDLSFERPFLDNAVGLIDRDPLAPNHQTRAEVWITSWLSDLAAVNPKYAYDIFSDIDLDQGIPNLAKYKVMLIDTHPEYWSDNMRTNLEAYLNGGGHLVFIAGNGLYDRVTVTSAGNLRFQNGVGGSNCGDPQGGNPACPGRDLFRYKNATYPNGRSERGVLGEAYETYYSFIGAKEGTGWAYYVFDNTNPFLSGLSNGQQFGAVAGLNNGLQAAGWEVDQWLMPLLPQFMPCGDFPSFMCTTSHSTLAAIPIASSTPTFVAGEPESDIVYRPIAGGGWVFAAGSITFGGVLAIDPTVQGIVKNALDYAIR
jgi:hypothetical protein